MPPIHTREWFKERIAQAKIEVGQWPSWMQGHSVVVASFPHAGDLRATEETKRPGIVSKPTRKAKV
jgi:hypothetical protein